ncbi:hypothetical protein SAMN05444678_11142 [Sphingomonas sp. YR710]|uniref:hypothetical protein n=1 Tax=Sphingomonas sp. YR710 TaxID=1882773 RepID=UPI0008826E60|nr:hypothetical protein [Sphingomonas sp. YR710]SDD26887.1 hypothetical protein SAMN05444678_11142 [Sphingomonas sp. YR710]
MTTLSTGSRPPRESARMRFSALLAILALFGMLALATWHDAAPHVHDADHPASVDVHHAPTPDHQPDLADLMHVAAHAVLHTVIPPTSPVIVMAIAPVTSGWMPAQTQFHGSLAPPSILRPPRG